MIAGMASRMRKPMMAAKQHHVTLVPVCSGMCLMEKNRDIKKIPVCCAGQWGGATPASQDLSIEVPDNKPKMLVTKGDKEQMAVGGSPSSSSAHGSFGAYGCFGLDIDNDVDALSN